MPSSRDLLATAEMLKDMLVARATGDQSGRDGEYRHLRSALMAAPSIRSKLPAFLEDCRTLSEFWGYIGDKFGTYKERRQHLKEEFHPLLATLEAGGVSPGDEIAGDALTNLNWDHVQAAWKKALDRKTSDPEGAITAARTLLESVCKHVLDEAGATYDSKADLPKLYSLTADQLNLAPSKHTQEIFKQILGGCHSVVQGLGSLRSKIGDAHGQGKNAVKPAPRHAELAVNLAGAMATFLAQTWEKLKIEAPANNERRR